ncbi:MAG: hypothetical protein VX899_19685 [Myxococcota bacterium]|nr:hypothetical protein [Myxococcota bacterium]
MSVFGALRRALGVFKPVAPVAFAVGVGRGLMRRALGNLADTPWGEQNELWRVVGVLLDLPYLALVVGAVMVWGLLRLEAREPELGDALRRVLPRRLLWVLGAKLGIACFLPWLAFHALAMAVTAQLTLRADARWDVESRGLLRPILVLGLPYAVWALLLLGVDLWPRTPWWMALLWGLDGVAVVLFTMAVGAWFLQREALGLTQTRAPEGE